MNDENLRYNKTEEIAIKECNKIEKVRNRLYCLGLLGSHCNGRSFGNVSVRYKKKNSFVITATQTGDYPKLTPLYYSLVKKMDFKKGLIYSVGPSKPSCQSGLHWSVYEIDSQINAVIHVYNEKVVEYMVDNDYLSISDTNYDTFYNQKISNDIKELYKNVDPFLNNAFLVTGELEGAVVFGKTLGEAEKSLYTILNKVLKK